MVSCWQGSMWCFAIVTIKGPLYLEREDLKVAKHLSAMCASQFSEQRLKQNKTATKNDIKSLWREPVDHAHKILTNPCIHMWKWRKHVKMRIVALLLRDFQMFLT